MCETWFTCFVDITLLIIPSITNYVSTEAAKTIKYHYFLLSKQRIKYIEGSVKNQSETREDVNFMSRWEIPREFQRMK